MTSTTVGFGHTELARVSIGQPGRSPGCGSGRRLQGDGVAEGFELPDQAVDLPGGVDAAVVEVRAEILEPGRRVGQQMPDDHENGSRDGDQGLAFAPTLDHTPVACGQVRTGKSRCRGRRWPRRYRARP